MPKKYQRTRQSHRSLFARRFTLVGLFVVALLLIPLVHVHAATLSSASLSLSDPRPSNLTTAYTFTGSSVTLSPIRCIKMVYTDSGGTTPSSMSTNGGGVTLDTAATNYIPTPASWTLNKPANGTLTLTNAGGETPASAAARKVVVNGITNSSVADTRFFLTFSTYNNTDCSTSPVDTSVVTFILTNGSTLSLTVDQTLSFTVNAVTSGQSCNGATTTQASTATTIPFGTINATTNGIVCQDLQAATNATSGYTIYARYTAAPTNALGQTIAAHSGSNGTPSSFSTAGTEAYGYTTDDFTLGTGTANRFQSNKWAAMTTSNAEVAYESAGVTSTSYHVAHQVGVSSTTRPGTYQTTIIYTCTPVY